MQQISRANNFRHILGQRVDYTTYELASNQILEMGTSSNGGYVCVSTVHMVMEGLDNAEYRRTVNSANLITPDGMPLVWGLKLLGVQAPERVYGPALMSFLCRRSAEQGIAVGFYGGTEETLSQMQQNLIDEIPDLKIAYAYSPPFRPLSEDEDRKITAEILDSGSQILFVGLGCPKQERWMASHTDRLPIALVGVGAAFEFIAGMKPMAPTWMQRIGLEWLYRLLSEPQRLWKRYLYLNPRFLFHFTLQLLGLKKYPAVDDSGG